MDANVAGFVQQLADGYVSLTPVSLKKVEAGRLQQLQVEIEKLSREVRGEIVSQDDVAAMQKKNRRLQRLSQARLVLQTFRQKSRV